MLIVIVAHHFRDGRVRVALAMQQDRAFNACGRSSGSGASRPFMLEPSVLPLVYMPQLFVYSRERAAPLLFG
jgi:hypothetical protein